MNGYDAYVVKTRNKINERISNSAYKAYLKPFANHMNTLADNTKLNYIVFVDEFLSDTKKKPEELTMEDYDNFMVKKSEYVSGHQVLAYHALSHFAEYMYASDKANKNLMQYVRRPKFKESRETISKREKGYLTEDEIKKFLNNVRNGCGNDLAKAKQKDWVERDMCLMLVALTTGLRCAGLFKLDVDDIDFENNTITVVDKGDKIQEYNIAENILPYIIDWLAKREKFASADEKALFVSNRGTRMTSGSIYACVKKYSANIEGKSISPHKLRASYGTALYEKTHDIYFVSKAMGHAGVEVTKRYIRGKDNQIRKDAAVFMNSVVG